MEHASHECPMCGAVMGTDPQPAAMRKYAEFLDRIDTLHRRLGEAEQGTWRLTTIDVMCPPCRETLVGIEIERGEALIAAVRARIDALQTAHAEALRRSA